MTQPPPNNLFARFFDTNLPHFYVVGSAFLAIVGNGIYDLLLDWLGSSPWARLGIVAVALSIVLGIAWGFRGWLLWVRARSKPIRSSIPKEKEADPHAGLILALGLNPTGAEAAILDWHLREATLKHCWLIVSPEVKASDKYRQVASSLFVRGVRVHPLDIPDATRADCSYEAVKKGIVEARQYEDSSPLIVDITGGLRPMTAGAVLACRDEGVPMQYWTSKYEGGLPIPGTQVAVKVEMFQEVAEVTS